MFRAVTQMWRMLPNQAQKAEAVTARLSAMRVEGEAGGGMVRATFDGMGSMIGIDIDSAILSDKTVVEVRPAFAGGPLGPYCDRLYYSAPCANPPLPPLPPPHAPPHRSVAPPRAVSRN